MKTRMLLAIAAGAAIVVSRSLIAADEAAEKTEFQAKCPVSGEAASKDHAVDFKGKKVLFCCDDCPKAFAKEPAKFAAKVHHQLLGTGQIVQFACPLSGRPINPEKSVELAGAKFAFCCDNCKGKFEKASADEKLALVFKDISKGFTLQTECPVSSKKIDVTKMVEFKGKKVFFCCGNCPKAFEADPEKFVSKLPQLKEDKEEKATN